MRCRSSLVFAFAAWVPVAASAAPSESACLPPDTEQTLAECKPGGASGGKRAGAPALALPVSGRLRVPVAAASQKPAPGFALEEAQRTAQTRIEQRKFSLLQR